MEYFQYDTLDITINREGSKHYSKVSFPARNGLYSEIKTRDYIFQFNLNGEIKHIQGRTKTWPHPNEWLKRTAANDWVYYSTAGYTGALSFVGEYYLPCFSYETNTVFSTYSFDSQVTGNALHHLDALYKKITDHRSATIPETLEAFFSDVTCHDMKMLKQREEKLYSIIGDRITVLPPDTRHVDYDVIPVIIADGCLYNCGFCSVKTGRKFTPRSQSEIISQVDDLKAFYGRDIINYNSVFLGQHDALHSGPELIQFSATSAYDRFEFSRSYMKEPKLFLFGSVESLLSAQDSLFDMIDGLPFYTYINIGLESADQATLKQLGKPLNVHNVEKAFDRMMQVNQQYKNIEITANFVMGSSLPPGHLISISEMAGNRLGRHYGKGCIYLSPIKNGSDNREMQKKFTELKNLNRLPTFLYIIQKL